MNRLYALCVCLMIGGVTYTQPADSSTAPVTLRTFLSEVARYHPLAKNARLLELEANAALQTARGAFDPKLYTDWQQKSFSGKDYYTIGASGVKVQTPFGLSIKTEFNTARGLFLNPENKLPMEGQGVLGISLPLLNGLWFDPYRAELQQAKIAIPASIAARQGQMNDLLLSAGISFIDWSVSWHQIQVFQQAVEIARIRLRNVVESYSQGDKPAVDTLESYIQLQNRLFDLNEAQAAYTNARQTLESFFWQAGTPGNTTGMLQYKQPEPFVDTTTYLLPALDPLLADLINRHPDLQQLQFDMQKLDIDRRLATEQLKPRLDLSYALLGTGTDFTPDIANTLLRDILMQNYKWSLQASFPLFLRKERGKIALVKVKQERTSNKLTQKQTEIETKLRNYYNELQINIQQIDLYRGVRDNYQTLLQAEQIKFDLGESSVFLLNTREQKLLEAQIKYIKLQGMYEKNKLALSWAAGTLVRDIE